MKHLFCFLCIAFCLIACAKEKNNSDSIQTVLDDKLLEDGDLICRLGKTWYSNLFRRKASSEKKYSHMGIVLYAGTDSCSVLHVENGDDHKGVVVEPLSSFLSHSCRVGVYRLQLPDTTISRFEEEAVMYYHRQTPFDLAFDSFSDDKLYCTELVAVCLQKADPLLDIQPTLMVAGKKVYSLDDLFSLPFVSSVKM